MEIGLLAIETGAAAGRQATENARANVKRQKIKILITEILHKKAAKFTRPATSAKIHSCKLVAACGKIVW